MAGCLLSPPPTHPDHPPQTGAYGKVVSHVIIGLKTVKGTKQLKLDPVIYDSLQKEKVQVSRGWAAVGAVRS